MMGLNTQILSIMLFLLCYLESEEYTFRVCDTLLNSGPIGDMAIGQADEPEVN